ncbi:MAG: hypothetical protein K9G41_11035 [Flavobacteriales bacterium]|nr:hypothetical protein [Flavobacteriales bacterium]
MHSITSLILIISLAVSGARNTPSNNNQPQADYSQCVQKYRSAWGEDCSQCTSWKDSYVVYLKNTCSESIDVMICVQEETKQWKKFQHTSMAAGDSLRAYACVGTGKYLAWARRAGDESITFPTLEQVNRDY